MTEDNNILNISVFGSYGRGNADSSSDLDILVLCRDGGGVQSEDFVRSRVSREFNIPPSISWYGEKKLKDFFKAGDLFSWHLYKESFPLFGYEHIRDILGTPKKYGNYIGDINGLIEILVEVPNHIVRYPQNIVFELGIAYVCLRNIALTASSVLGGQLDFSRYSPFELSGQEIPMSKNKYDLLIECRHASTRGADAPPINEDFEKTLAQSISWALKVKEAVECKLQ